jgi:anaerobic selenocysteine-containing dehydrogenase
MAMSTEVLTTACSLDCPDACTLAVTVTDGRIVDVDAGAGNPLTQGWICAKVKRSAERVYSPDRVLTPLRRIGAKGAGEFEPITWDAALDLLAEQIRAAIAAHGPEAVVGFTYNSSAPVIERASATDALLGALGATYVEPTICAATADAAWTSVFGDMPSADPADVVHADLVVIWGANPTVSNTHFPPLVRQATDRGARLVVIDPRRTAMAARSDLHLAVQPGTDVVLALAVAAHWERTGRIDRGFIDRWADGLDGLLAAARPWTLERAAEVCGLAIDDIVTLADWWATAAPAMLRIGWGQERNSNGGAACRAILALPVLLGRFGLRGDGIIGSTRVDDVQPERRWPTSDHAERRRVRLHEVGAWLAPGSDVPCRVVLVQGANPALMCPDQGAVIEAFSRPDVFTVVHDQVVTDTARYADLVLPATTSFEIDDIVTSYGATVVVPVRAVIDRVGESRSNDELGRALADRLGIDAVAAMPSGVAGLVATSPGGAGPRAVDNSALQFVDALPSGGRARLVDPVVGAPDYHPVESAFPLTLISPATSKMVNSMFGEFQGLEPSVVVHPDEASVRGLDSGSMVRVHNERGEVRVRLVVSTDVRPGVAVMAKGIWLRDHDGRRGVNLLTSPTSDPLAGGACFNDTRVDVTAG